MEDIRGDRLLIIMTHPTLPWLALKHLFKLKIPSDFRKALSFAPKCQGSEVPLN